MTLQEWIDYGMQHGFIIEPRCATHDDLYTDEEMDAYVFNDEDICIPVLRVRTDIPWFAE